MSDDKSTARKSKDHHGHGHGHGGHGSNQLPRCHCNWKMCRTYQRAFRDYKDGSVDDDDDDKQNNSNSNFASMSSIMSEDTGSGNNNSINELMNGVVRMKFSESDETHRAVKEAWDKILGVEEAKREAWKDGECKYYIAKHHFTENILKECKKAKKSWSWTEPLSKDEALHLLYEVNNDYMWGGVAYLKVPDVPKKVVKELVEQVKNTGVLRQNSLSDMSVKSTMSSKPTQGNNTNNSKKQQLNDLLAALPTGLADDSGDEAPKKSKKLGSLGTDPMHRSMPTLGGRSLSTGEKKKKKKKDALNDSTHSERSSKSAKEKSSSTSSSSKHHHHHAPSSPTSSSRKLKSPSRKDKDKKKVKNVEDFEGELLELVDKGGESKSAEKISQLQTELFEQQTIAEAAQEDLEASKREVTRLREQIANMQLKVGRVSAIFESDDVDEMEKLRLSLSSTMELHTAERESFQSRVDDQDKRITQLEEQLRREKGKTRKLEMERMKLEADRDKSVGLSSRRLGFVEELENKLSAEKAKARETERELLDSIGEQKSKLAAALMEVSQAEMKMLAMEKELMDLKQSRGASGNGVASQREGADVLEMKIIALEEENEKLKKRLREVEAAGADDAGRQPTETSRALPMGQGDASSNARIAELEAEVKKLVAKNRKLAVAASGASSASIGGGGGGGGGGDITLKQAIDALEREKKKLELQNVNQMKTIQALEGNIDKADEAAIERAKREDDLERATALLANLYFTKRNAELLEKVASDLALPVDEEKRGDPMPPSQSELLQSVLQKKQARWWRSLDGFMGKTGYVRQAQKKRSSNLAE